MRGKSSTTELYFQPPQPFLALPFLGHTHLNFCSNSVMSWLLDLRQRTHSRIFFTLGVEGGQEIMWYLNTHLCSLVPHPGDRPSVSQARPPVGRWACGRMPDLTRLCVPGPAGSWSVFLMILFMLSSGLKSSKDRMVVSPKLTCWTSHATLVGDKTHEEMTKVMRS